MNAPWEPMFGPLVDDARYANHLTAVEAEQRGSIRVAVTMRPPRLRLRSADVERGAGDKSPPPPGQELA